MDAYARLTNRRERAYLDQLLHLVPALDREYLKDYYDKQKAELDKAKKKSAAEQRGVQRNGIGRRPAPQRRR